MSGKEGDGGAGGPKGGEMREAAAAAVGALVGDGCRQVGEATAVCVERLLALGRSLVAQAR